MFLDFIILPEEYVKMPIMKAWSLWVSVLALPVCEMAWLHNCDAVLSCGVDA